MAKIELKWCNHCNRETLHTWTCDNLDYEPGETPEFNLICLACMNINNPVEESIVAPLNAKLEGFKNGLG